MSTLALRLEDRLPRAGAIFALGLAVLLGVVTAFDVRAGAMVAAALVAPVLVWAPPRIGFALLALALGLNLTVLTSPVNVSLPQLAAVALIGAIVIRSRSLPGRAGTWGGIGMLFIIAGLPSLTHAVDMRAALTGFAQLAVIAAVLAAVTRLVVNDERRVDNGLKLLLVGGAISLLPALAQVLFGIGPVEYRIGGMMRAYSTYAQPNSYGLYLCGLLPVALAVAITTRKARWYALALAIGVALALTGSRGAWAGAIAGLGMYYVMTFRPRASTLLAAAGGIALIVIAFMLMPRSFIVGRFSMNDWSSQQRLLILLTAIDGIVRNPVFGYGPGSFEAMLPQIARTGLTDDVRMPHNILLHIWFELGLLALIVFVGALVAYYRAAFRVPRAERDPRLAGLVAGVTAMLAAAMFGTLFIRGIQEQFVVLVALTCATLRFHRGAVVRPARGEVSP
jgi:O-antigen ligase